jgi:hypothetical protein
VVEEERVVEGGGLPGLALVLAAAERAEQDQVGQDRLFLLPPGLAVVPGRTSRRAADRCRPRA